MSAHTWIPRLAGVAAAAVLGGAARGAAARDDEAVSGERVVAAVAARTPLTDRCASQPDEQRTVFRVRPSGRVAFLGADAVRPSCVARALAPMRFARSRRGSAAAFDVALTEHGLLVTRIALDPIVHVRAAEATDRRSRRVAVRMMRAVARASRRAERIHACYRSRGEDRPATIRLAWRVRDGLLVQTSVHADPENASLARCVSVRASQMIGDVGSARGVALVVDLTPRR